MRLLPCAVRSSHVHPSEQSNLKHSSLSMFRLRTVFALRARAYPRSLRGPPAPLARRGAAQRIVAQASNASVERRPKPTSAKEAIETGLVVFKEKHDYEEAVLLFKAALELKPNDDEAMAALYNLGCALTKLKQWKPAADAIVSAVNDYRLKLSVALKVRSTFASHACRSPCSIRAVCARRAACIEVSQEL